MATRPKEEVILLKDEDFVEASAYLRVLEKRMLNNDSINRIMDAPNASEALKLLSQNSEYEFSALKRTEDYESVLKDELKKTYDLLYKLSNHREVVDIPAAKYDFHNLKVALKSKYLNKDMSYLYSNVTTLNIEDAESFIFKGEKRDDLPEYVLNAVDEAEGSFAENKDPQEIDIILDRHMFAYMLSLCEKAENDFITEYVRLSIDFYNIKTLMRVKNMQKGTRFLNECFVPGGLTDTDYFLEHYDKQPDALASVFYYKYFGDTVRKGLDDYSKTGNYGSLERLFDNCLIEYVKKAKYVAFGAAVLFSYIISKENEIRQIRILVTCKKNNIRDDMLKERLRDNYA